MKHYVVEDKFVYDIEASSMKNAIKKFKEGKFVQREATFGDTIIVCQETGEEEELC